MHIIFLQLLTVEGYQTLIMVRWRWTQLNWAPRLVTAASLVTSWWVWPVAPVLLMACGQAKNQLVKVSI